MSITLLSAALLPLSVGGMSHYCGRKTLLVISATLFSISSCVIALAANVTMLLVGRLIVGCAIGQFHIERPSRFKYYSKAKKELH